MNKLKSKSLTKLILTSVVLLSFLSLAKEEVMEVNHFCSSKPNCVSSFEKRKSFSIEPMENVESSWSDLEDRILEAMKSICVIKKIESKENFLHIVAITPLMKYKDDIYFWFDSKENTLSFKSEAQTGYWDMGNNKKRLNKFKTVFLAQSK